MKTITLIKSDWDSGWAGVVGLVVGNATEDSDLDTAPDIFFAQITFSGGEGFPFAKEKAAPWSAEALREARIMAAENAMVIAVAMLDGITLGQGEFFHEASEWIDGYSHDLVLTQTPE